MMVTMNADAGNSQCLCDASGKLKLCKHSNDAALDVQNVEVPCFHSLNSHWFYDLS